MRLLAVPTMSPWLMQRELALFSLYRLLEAALLGLLVFSPWGALMGEVVDPALAIAVGLGYLVASVGLLLHARQPQIDHPAHAVVGVLVDIAVAALIGLEAFDEADVEALDLLRCLGSHLLDVHATLCLLYTSPSPRDS